MSSVEPYPEGVVAVPARIPGTAFFPGGAGLWGVKPGAPLPPMPVGGVMVLGHDFHSEIAFQASLAQRTEVPDKPTDRYRIPSTWIALRQLFADVALPLERCFFTNVYMGLRAGGGSVGRFPGSLNAGYVARCRRLFTQQLAAQRPSSIITLGIWVPGFIAPLAPRLAQWQAARTFGTLDEAGPVVHGVDFLRGVAQNCTVVALTHPSLRRSNVGRRRYGGLAGQEAELAMLRGVAEKTTSTFRV
jgi:uracil-DNA glycosylase